MPSATTPAAETASSAGEASTDQTAVAANVSNTGLPSHEVEGNGRVTSVIPGTACPTLQFKVQGITVKTDATTLFEGGACADIQVGVKVEVKGLRQADGTVLARRIEFDDDDDDNNP